MWFCGFSVSFSLSERREKEGKGATTEQETRHSAEQERSKWFSVGRNPILSSPAIFGFVFKGGRW